jgi:phospho-N-acetylmuramoyl-pentapeptide-transferase
LMNLTHTAAAIAGLAPFAFSQALGGKYIDFLKNRYMGQYIREDGPQSHQSKAGTPTAGGVLMLAAFLFGIGAVAALQGPAFLSAPVLLVVGVTIAFGLLGFVDDYLKISKKKNKGVSGYTKLMVQVVVGATLGVYMMLTSPAGGTVSLFGLASIDMGWLYPVFTAFVITGASNSTNLTDGLDGLASGTLLMTFMTLSLLLFGISQPDLAMVSQALAGACLGFLLFNRYPARIFMGDTGSLALGGALGALVILGKVEMWIALLGAIYILESVSVILQVISFKTTGKRIFKMSPLHHHFELCGLKETQVVYSFVTFQFLCCLLAVFLYNRG